MCSSIWELTSVGASVIVCSYCFYVVCTSYDFLGGRVVLSYWYVDLTLDNKSSFLGLNPVGKNFCHEDLTMDRDCEFRNLTLLLKVSVLWT